MPIDMNINKKILTLLTFNLVCFYVSQVVLGENLTSGGESESTEYKSNITAEELPKTTEINSEERAAVRVKAKELENEKKELIKLKNEFQKIYEKSKQNEENKEKSKKVISTNIEKNEKVKSEETLSGEKHDTSPSVKKESELADKVATEDEVKKEEKDKSIIIKKDEIINPFEIAENLYRMGGYERALEMYSLINEEDIEDKKATWITYQIANCYRKLRVFDKALATYKKIQDEYEGTYWGKQAQWYIDEIKWRKGVQGPLEMVDER